MKDQPTLNPDEERAMREARREYYFNLVVQALKWTFIFAFLSPVGWGAFFLIFCLVAWVYPPIEQVLYAIWLIFLVILPGLLMLLAFWGIVQLLRLSEKNSELKEENLQLKCLVESLKGQLNLTKHN
jgi:hypothetical protein